MIECRLASPSILTLRRLTRVRDIRTSSRYSGPQILGNSLGGISDHDTIAQVKPDKAGQEIKVGGDVVPVSVSLDDALHSLKFTLAGEGDKLYSIQVRG